VTLQEILKRKARQELEEEETRSDCLYCPRRSKLDRIS
jgi:hypothetical protein